MAIFFVFVFYKYRRDFIKGNYMNFIYTKSLNAQNPPKNNLLKNNQISTNKAYFRSLKTELNGDKVSFQSINLEDNNYNIYGDKSEEIRQLIPPELKPLLKSLPKAELHVHAKGAVTLSVIRQKLRQRGYTEEQIAAATTFPDYFVDLDHFRNVYTKFSSLLVTPEEMKDSAYFTCTRAAEDNVKYLELRFNPFSKGQNPYKMMEMFIKGIVDAQNDLLKKINFKQTVKIIILAKRDNAPQEVMEFAKTAVELAKNPDNMVVGFDLAGAEAHHTVLKHENALKYVKDKGLYLTVHAGETPLSVDDKYSLTGSQSIRKAVETGTNRLGHALHLMDDPELVELVKKLRITVESPPTANVSIKNVESWKKHPFKQMVDAGVNVAVCTDNPTLFKTTISREFERLYKHSYISSWDTMKTLIMNGIYGGFLSTREKAGLVKEFKDELSKIEKDPYFKSTIKKYLTPQKTSGFPEVLLKFLRR